MPEQRLRLDVQADMSGNLKQEIDLIASSLDKAKSASGGGSGGVGGGVGRGFREVGLLEKLGGDAATHFGALGKAAIGIGAPTAAVVGLAAVAEKAARGINILANSTSTYYEKQEALLATFVPFYDKFAAFRDAITGVTEALRVLKMEAEQQIQSTQLGAAFYAQRAGAEQRIAGAGASIQGVGAYPLAGGIYNADLMSFGGQIEYQNQLGRNAALSGVARAQRAEMSARAENEAAQRRLRLADANNINARGTYEDAQQRFRQSRDQRNDITGDLRRLEQEYRDNPNNPFRGINLFHGVSGAARRSAMNPLRAGEARLEVEQTSTNLDIARTQADRSHQEYENAFANAQQTRQQLLEREAATRRSILEISKQELDVLSQQNQRMGEIQSRLGRMSRGGRQAGLEALRSVLRVGIDNSSPEAIALAEQIDPARIRNMANRSGMDFIRNQVVPEFGTERESSFFDFAGGATQEDVQRRMIQIRATMTDALNGVEDRLAVGLADTIVGGLTRLIEALQRDFNRRIQDIQEQQLQRSSRGAT